jgi:hypothetical protein
MPRNTQGETKKKKSKLSYRDLRTLGCAWHKNKILKSQCPKHLLCTVTTQRTFENLLPVQARQDVEGHKHQVPEGCKGENFKKRPVPQGKETYYYRHTGSRGDALWHGSASRRRLTEFSKVTIQ